MPEPNHSEVYHIHKMTRFSSRGSLPARRDAFVPSRHKVIAQRGYHYATMFMMWGAPATSFGFCPRRREELLGFGGWLFAGGEDCAQIGVGLRSKSTAAIAAQNLPKRRLLKVSQQQSVRSYRWCQLCSAPVATGSFSNLPSFLETIASQ